jgi:hypothetical protein
LLLFLCCRRRYVVVVVDVAHEKQRWIKRPNELIRKFRDGMSRKDAFEKKKGKQLIRCARKKQELKGKSWRKNNRRTKENLKNGNGLTDNKRPKRSLECIYH